MIKRFALSSVMSLLLVALAAAPAMAKPDDASDKSDHSDTSQCDGDPTGKSDKGHGANQGGPYDNTCPAGESSNGNGGGNAKGKPCAGCVGQADDKNPGAQSGKGQMENGSDDNAGYECDRNHGIGKGNPAHTGCVEQRGLQLDDSSFEGFAAVLSESDVSGRDDFEDSEVSGDPGFAEVLGEFLSRDDSSSVLGGAFVAPSALARTGIDAPELVLAALVLITIGSAARRRGLLRQDS